MVPAREIASCCFCGLSCCRDLQDLPDVGSLWRFRLSFPTWVSVCCSAWHSVFCSRHFLFCPCQLPPTRTGSCTWVSSCLMKLSCQWTVPLEPCHSWPSRNPSHLDSTCWMAGPVDAALSQPSVLLFLTALPTGCHSGQIWLSPSLMLTPHSLTPPVLQRCHRQQAKLPCLMAKKLLTT